MVLVALQLRFMPGSDSPSMFRGLFLTGLPGTGKTTLARAVAAELAIKGRNAAVLDGDELRREQRDHDFSPAGRGHQAQRAIHAAQAILAQGGVPLIALVAPDRSVRLALRRALPGVGEVLLIRSVPARAAWPGTVYEYGSADLVLADNLPLRDSVAVLLATLGIQ